MCIKCDEGIETRLKHSFKRPHKLIIQFKANYFVFHFYTVKHFYLRCKKNTCSYVCACAASEAFASLTYWRKLSKIPIGFYKI